LTCSQGVIKKGYGLLKKEEALEHGKKRLVS
jgi:hypothetical protein